MSFNTKLSYIQLNAKNANDLKVAADFYEKLGFVNVQPSGLQSKDDFWLVNQNKNEIVLKLSVSQQNTKVQLAFEIDQELANKLTGFEQKDHQYSGTDPLGNSIVLSNVSPFSTKPLALNHSKKTSIKDQEIKLSLKSFDTNKKYKIGVLTSGGDSQGMNCAVRAVVRTALYYGHEPYTILEGYQGLVEGGNKIVKCGWGDVRRFLHISGTVIGSARCKEFRTEEGRRKAAFNMISFGIDMLVVIGGDGTLTGADLFRSEWSHHLDALFKNNDISFEQKEKYHELKIVGLVGSIDNDMAMTDLTIGAVSCLHRICESVDNITSTAISHQRVFIVEVMGRNCGWLALMSAVCSSADFVLVPEQPPKKGWEDSLCERILKSKELGRRSSIIIVSEGAIDTDLKPIKAEYIKDILLERVNIDARTTFLGHVQRGGNPSTTDRLIGTVQGIKAVEVLLGAKPGDPSLMININEGNVSTHPLVDAVQKTKDGAEAIKQRHFDKSMEQRDKEFRTMWKVYKESSYIKDVPKKTQIQKFSIGIMHVGAPAAGMNSATHALSRLCITNNCTPLAIYNGFNGLLNDEVEEIKWIDVTNWMSRGGSELGTNRNTPDIDYGMVAYKLQKHKIDALVLIGGFEAYRSLYLLNENKPNYPAFRIPLIVIPATISNNVPGTEYSLGSDTALNIITESCDKLIQSAEASRKRVFVVEVHGAKSGYLATISGITSGATRVYTPEEGISLKDISKDVYILKEKFKHDKDYNKTNVGRLIIRSEKASDTYSTEMLSKIFNAEGKGLFDSKTAVLGHIQQGGITSALDRIRAVKLAYMSFFHIKSLLGKSSQEERQCACLISYSLGSTKFINVDELYEETDWKNRCPKNCWFENYKTYNSMMAHYDTNFE